MSVLRYSRPGTAGTVLVDQGPANSGTRTYIGGSLVTGESGTKRVPPPLPATTPERRAQMAAYKARANTPCGAGVPTSKKPCARTLGHRDLHMDAETMERKSLARRSAA